MAKKTNVEKPRHEMTRRQRSRWKKQERRRRIILTISIVVVVAVLAVVGYGVITGWYLPKYKPLHETIIEVNDTEFNMEYCVDATYYLLGDYYYYAEYYFSYVIEAIEQYELIRQEAEEMGYTVSEDEVTELLESYGYEDVPAIRDALRSSLLLSQLSDDYFEPQVPTSADQRYLAAMFLESEEQADEISARLEAGEGFASLAAEYSVESVTQAASGVLGWVSEDLLALDIDSSVLIENAFSLEVGVVSQPLYEERTKSVGYWLIEVISIDDSADPTVADVRAMVLGSEQEAIEIRDRLEAGEDFAELAAEYSLDTESGEEGGEFEAAEGDGSTAFDDYVFGEDVELGVLSQPIRDDEFSSVGGYWLIKVFFSADDMALDDDSRTLLLAELLDNWVDSLFDDPDNVVVSYLDDDKLEWAVSYLVGS